MATSFILPFFTVPKEQQASGSRFSTFVKCLRLWNFRLFSTERHLANQLKNNAFYPFKQQQRDGG